MKNKIIMIMAACFFIGTTQSAFRSKTRRLLKITGAAALLKGGYNAISYVKELKNDVEDFNETRQDYKINRERILNQNQKTSEQLKDLGLENSFFSDSSNNMMAHRILPYIRSADEKYPWRFKDMMLDVSDKRHKSLRQNTFKELEHIDKFCGATPGHEYFSMAYMKPLGLLSEKWSDMSWKASDKLNTSPRNIDRHANALKTTGLTWASVGAAALWCAKKLRK